jgi:hypothetical protein
MRTVLPAALLAHGHAGLTGFFDERVLAGIGFPTDDEQFDGASGVEDFLDGPEAPHSSAF